jgi:hypothetical protein
MKSCLVIVFGLFLIGCAGTGTAPTPEHEPSASFAAVSGTLNEGSQDLDQTYQAALIGYRTQADFACRQPLYAAYFKQRLAPGPAYAPCQETIPFAVQTQYDGIQVQWLDPTRVQSVHLLFASNSQALASQFGHVALRLVICPVGSRSPEACDANLAEHLVLGFQAHIDDFSLDTLKALQGDYSAYLFASRFLDTYEQYAIGEFREIHSLPLNLDSAQREALARGLADIHWRYAGTYNFFVRNCATLLQDALRVAWPDYAHAPGLTQTYLRPDHLFAAVKASPLADGGKLASLPTAEREGYYFSSTLAFYESALSQVKRAMTHPGFDDLEGYLKQTPASRRQTRAEDPHYSSALKGDRQLYQAQLMLEEYAVLRSERQMMIEAARYFAEQDFLAREPAIQARLDATQAQVFETCLLKPLRQRLSPVRRHAGVPDVSDRFSDLAGPAPLCLSAQGRELLRATIANIKDAESPQWRRLNDVARYWADSIENTRQLKQLL